MTTSEEVAERSTLLVVDPEGLAARRGRETLLVTGAARGATSMVAFALLRAGYPLTTTPTTTNHEDDDFVDAREDPTRLASLIAEHDASRPRWGFKLPHAVFDPAWYVSHLRRPVVMMVYRNPLAIARSVRRRAPHWPSHRGGLQRALRRSLFMLTAGTQLLAEEAPLILVDADRAFATPAAFVDELVEVLALQVEVPEREAIAEAIARPGYKSV